MGDARGHSPVVTWTTEDVLTFLLGYGRCPTDLRVETLPGWWFNLVLLVEADGERLVLRRYGVTPPEEVRWELAVLTHLRAHEFPTIGPLPRSDVENDRLSEFLGKPAVLYPYIEGTNRGALDWAPAVAQTAAAVARLHELTSELKVPYPRVASGTESRRMLREFLKTMESRGVAATEPGLRGLVDASRAGLERFEARLAEHAEGLPRGVVHHDAHHGNVLFNDGRLVALIDFDDAHEGYLVADLAAMVENWADEQVTGQALNREKAVRVVREYERHRRLTEAERELLPDFVQVFMLADATEMVRGEMAQGADSETAVNEDRTYVQYLDLVRDTGWAAALRGAPTSSAGSR